MFNKEKFVSAMKEKNLRQEDVSKALSIDESTLYRKMRGISDFTRAEVQALRELLSLNAKEAEAVFFDQESA